MLVVDPIKLFLFRPMGDEEYLKYTESFALIPQVFSNPNLVRKQSMQRTSFQSPNRFAGTKKMASSNKLVAFPSYLGGLDESSNHMDDSFSVGYSLHY